MQTMVQVTTEAARFEQCLINHCSPVLAGLKSANMMSFSVINPAEFVQMFAQYRRLFREKGVSLTMLRYTEQNALIYVYRVQKLQQDWQKPGVAEFFQNEGYASIDVKECIFQLRKRIRSQEDFPHEIGLFLGYPLHDVIGFIENAGRNCHCVGCWKVYAGVCDAQKQFAKFNKCKEVYKKLFSDGRPIMRLTVAA